MRLDSDTIRLVVIVACAVVGSAVRRRSTGIALLTWTLFVAFDLAINVPALRAPDLPGSQVLASAIFVIALPAAAAFGAARLNLWKTRPFLSGVVAGVSYVITLFVAAVASVNTGLLVP